MPQVVFLDECSTATANHGHPIYSVGGVSVDIEQVATVEEDWRRAKERRGLADIDLRFALTWPGSSKQRLEMIETISSLPLKQGIIVLLEDFRPQHIRDHDKDRRTDFYPHRTAFQYALQRLRAKQYSPGEGSHFVTFDHSDNFPRLADLYREMYIEEYEGRPSLRDRGYSESLTAATKGPLNEIADLVVGATTRWAACRCGIAHGKSIPERGELDRACQTILHLFPSMGSIPDRWTGWSFVVFTQNRTGKEQLKDSLDGWLRELTTEAQAKTGTDVIPF